ncbi:uncharacterized protein CDAR_401771 [Caerostris darwini]|uniref:Uncharacterized protein n=1 Tax=Caerostris darwini TaxID=1538125 RepID=A0AAV4UZY8_9ARAC|nr:uncharacterized protein CDAR_401771 [Caerostris darwini]
MENFKKKRTVARSAFTPVYNAINDVISEDGANLTDNFDLLANFDLLGEKYNELCVLNDEIMNLMLLETETNPADLDAETFVADEYNKKFKRINIIFKSKSNNREESDDSSSVQSISKRKFKLPLLELKKFGGEIKDWLPFCGQFSKNDSDPNIDEADKLQYLIQATLPSTRARELVENFPFKGKLSQSSRLFKITIWTR